MDVIRCATCTNGHATVNEARDCALRSAHEAQERADSLPQGIYEKNRQRFRVERSERTGHNFARLQDPHTRRFEVAPGAIKTLTREHLVKECTNRHALLAASRKPAA